MTASDIVIRPATPADVEELHGRRSPWRLKAVAVEDGDGRLLGVGGVAHQPFGLTAFMDIAPGVDPKRHRRAIVLGARAALRIVETAGRPVFVIRDRSAGGSKTLLSHFGFAPEGAAEEQEIWIWRRPSCHCK